MRIDDIDALLAVVQFSSLSQAAEHLGITQSAITRRLQSLEQSLGTRLLDRQTKPLRLTTVGQRVYQQCLALKREARRLYAMADDGGQPRGPLRLGLPQSLSELSLTYTLNNLRQEFSHAGITVSCGWGGQLLNRLENFDLDAMLAIGPANLAVPENIQAVKLKPMAVAVIARKGMFSEHITLGEAAETGWVLNPEGCGLRAGIIRYLEHSGSRFNVNVESAGALLQMQLVANGNGIGIVPLAVLESSPLRESLQIIASQEYQPENYLWLLSAPEQGNLMPAIRAFARQVADQLP
ncbi:LysR family transcriptional regulator [Tatumella punctata]|uniref:LysR family transcriptional regulator n=1 Tax=Tatumella punctata TaxID=399969 RepID=A0ABW1VJA8_9GAMM